MKKLISLLVLATLALCGGVASASTVDYTTASGQVSSGSNLVYVAKDVTEQAQYKITYTKTTKSGQVISSKTENAPKGSLVEYVQVPLVQALADNVGYVASTLDPEALSQKLEALHQKLFNQLNPNEKTSNGQIISPMSTACNSYNTASGSFDASAATINYAIDYNTENATCQINPTKYSVWQSLGSGTAWLHGYSWYNFSYNYTSNYPQVPYYAANAIHPALGADWYGPYGQNFTTLVQGNDILGTYYSGYTALN